MGGVRRTPEDQQSGELLAGGLTDLGTEDG
jgi:hypothetical protein